MFFCWQCNRLLDAALERQREGETNPVFVNLMSVCSSKLKLVAEPRVRIAYAFTHTQHPTSALFTDHTNQLKLTGSNGSSGRRAASGQRSCPFAAHKKKIRWRAKSQNYSGHKLPSGHQRE